MRRTYERMVHGWPLTAELIWAGQDLQVIVTGGERPHIGSVTIAAQAETGVALQTWRGPNHRDDVIGDDFAQTLAERTGGTVCVSCGIHYDNLQKAEIETIVQEAKHLLGEILGSF